MNVTVWIVGKDLKGTKINIIKRRIKLWQIM